MMLLPPPIQDGDDDGAMCPYCLQHFKQFCTRHACQRCHDKGMCEVEHARKGD